MYHSIKKHSLYILCALFIYSSTYAMYSGGGVGGSLIPGPGIGHALTVTPQPPSRAPLSTSGLTASKKRRIEKNLTASRAFEVLPRELLGKILPYLSASDLATLLKANPFIRDQIRKLLMEPFLKGESLRRVLGAETATQLIKNVAGPQDLEMLLTKIIEYLLHSQPSGIALHGILINTLERLIISHPREILDRVSHVGVVELHSSINPGHQKVLNFIFGILHRLAYNNKKSAPSSLDDIRQMVKLIKEGVSLRNDLQGTAVTESKESRDENEDYFFKALLDLVNFELLDPWVNQISEISARINGLEISRIPTVYYRAHLLGVVRARILMLKNKLRIGTEEMKLEVLKKLTWLFRKAEGPPHVVNILNRLENASLWIEILNRTKPYLESANEEIRRLVVIAITWVARNQEAAFWRAEGGWVLAQGLLKSLLGLLADETPAIRGNAVMAIVRIVRNLEAAFWRAEGGWVLAQGLLEPLQGFLADENPVVRNNAIMAIGWIARNLEAAFWRVEEGLVLAQGLLEPLQGFLADENPRVRDNAVVAIAEIARNLEAAFWRVEGRPELAQGLLEPLQGFLVDENPRVGGHAVVAIAEIARNLEAAFWRVEGRPELAQGLLEPLQGLLADENFIVRDNTVRAIIWAVKNLEAAFWRVEGRPELAQGLLEPLQGLLADENFIVRDNTVRAIIWAVKNLEAAFWRAEGGWVLAQGLLEPLQGFLADENPVVRNNAIMAIGWIARNLEAAFWEVESRWALSEDLFKSLRDLSKDENSIVRNNAVMAMGELTQALLAGEDFGVRGNAAMAITEEAGSSILDD